MMSEQAAAAKLNEHMVKVGIRPSYELIHSDTGTHVNKFVMRVKCPIVANGPMCTAEGSGLSKKKAKHQAASIFMQKYLGDGDNDTLVPAVKKNNSVSTTCAVRVTETHKNTLLQSLCLKWDLPKPKFNELDSTGPPHAKCFTFECRVTRLRTEGKGDTKSEAKLQATTKMIQLLMQEVEVYEVFESPKSTVSNSKEIVCLSDNLKGLQLPMSVGIYGRRKSSSTLSDVFSIGDTCSVLSSASSKTTDLQNLQIGVFNDSKKSDFTAGSNSEDSSSNISLIDFHSNFHQNTVSLIKAKSKSMPDLLADADSETSKKQLLKQFDYAQAISKIDATLETVENLLYDEILDTLENRKLPRRRPVIFLDHEFKVYINHGSRPKIIDGDQESTDPTIRIAALTKLLTDMKDHAAEISRKK